MKKLLIISTLTFNILGCSNEPEIVLPDVKQVDIKSDQQIIDQAISKNYSLLEGADSLDSPSKIYKYDHASQVELSKNYILISWQQHDQTSMDRAIVVAMSALGKDGGFFIHELDRLGKVDKRPINGHEVVNSFCVSESCMIKITR